MVPMSERGSGVWIKRRRLRGWRKHLIDVIEGGGHFRFAVRGPKGHSGTWTAFGRGNEYYIGARAVMGSTKVSLHGSGVCRVALTDQHYRMLPAQGLLQPLDRAFVKWRRLETPERGAVHVASVIFPSDHLVLPEPSGTYRKPLLFFGEAPLGKAAEFGFFFSRESVDALEVTLRTGRREASKLVRRWIMAPSYR